MGGASPETFSGEAQLKESPSDLTAEYLKLLNLPPALELLGFLGLLLPLGKDLRVLSRSQPGGGSGKTLFVQLQGGHWGLIKY